MGMSAAQNTALLWQRAWYNFPTMIYVYLPRQTALFIGVRGFITRRASSKRAC